MHTYILKITKVEVEPFHKYSINGSEAILWLGSISTINKYFREIYIFNYNSKSTQVLFKIKHNYHPLATLK